jgi:hypothetical protein
MPGDTTWTFREGTEEDLVRGRKSGIVLALLFVVAWTPGEASFHFMQIERVIAGVCGDVSQQAIQLRMRSGGQNLVSQGLLRAWDATGANPVIVINFGTDVAVASGGSRVLSQSAAFEIAQDPATDFTLSSVIPPSYLAAGSLTFESDGGVIYWRLSWGGTAYTGSHALSATNDANGDASPAFPTPIPWWSDQAIVFPGTASALSTTNAADYVVSVATADFTNNAGITSAVVSGSCIFGDRFETAGAHAWTTSP